MKLRTCPQCQGDLLPVQSVTLITRHYICAACRIVYVAEDGAIVTCSKPDQHVPIWPKLRAALMAQPSLAVARMGGMDVV